MTHVPHLHCTTRGLPVGEVVEVVLTVVVERVLVYIDTGVVLVELLLSEDDSVGEGGVVVVVDGNGMEEEEDIERKLGDDIRGAEVVLVVGCLLLLLLVEVDERGVVDGSSSVDERGVVVVVDGDGMEKKEGVEGSENEEDTEIRLVDGIRSDCEGRVDITSGEELVNDDRVGEDESEHSKGKSRDDDEIQGNTEETGSEEEYKDGKREVFREVLKLPGVSDSSPLPIMSSDIAAVKPEEKKNNKFLTAIVTEHVNVAEH